LVIGKRLGSEFSLTGSRDVQILETRRMEVEERETYLEGGRWGRR
jgi:hypothetical protein